MLGEMHVPATLLLCLLYCFSVISTKTVDSCNFTCDCVEKFDMKQLQLQNQILQQKVDEGSRAVKEIKEGIQSLLSEVRRVAKTEFLRGEEDKKGNTLDPQSEQSSLCPPKNLALELLPNMKQYFFSNATTMSWYEAKTFCEENKMLLASPTTQGELTFVYKRAKEINPLKHWWLSASNVGQSDGRDYKWTDGTPLPRNSGLWEKRHPYDFRHVGEACVNLFSHESGKLMVYLCTDELPFICESSAACLEN